MERSDFRCFNQTVYIPFIVFENGHSNMMLEIENVTRALLFKLEFKDIFIRLCRRKCKGNIAVSFQLSAKSRRSQGPGKGRSLESEVRIKALSFQWSTKELSGWKMVKMSFLL